jgi:hypothetical protein
MFCTLFSFHRWYVGIYTGLLIVLLEKKEFIQYIELMRIIVLAVRVDLVAFCR